MTSSAPTGPVVIDGPAGSGKSTVARRVARSLGFLYLDTGAMYRALAWEAERRGIAAGDGDSLASILRSGALTVEAGRNGAVGVSVGGRCVDDELRTEAVGRLASRLSALPEVRGEMVALQRRAAADGRVVAEGRDMGTVVFPAAPHKFFLDADPAERARRRWRDEVGAGSAVALEDVASGMAERDRNDRNRTVAPLRQATDAMRVDTTHMDVDAVVDAILARVRGNAGPRE